MIQRLFIFGLAVWLISSCAQVVAPTGGDKDTTPPKLDSLRSTENYQTNFRERELYFYFDEWVKLEKVREQVLISPRIEYADYEIKLGKRAVIFTFSEEFEFKSDQTYIINFGEAIQDLNEGNAAENMRIVFSTGEVIDSLEISGTVIDAVSGKVAKDKLVLLHDNLSDTTIFKNKPLYIARTDESGTFKFENLKADTFQVFALDDLSIQDYQYSDGSEPIGFLDTFIYLTDSVSVNVNLKLSKESEGLSLKRDRVLSNFGRISLLFSQTPEGVVASGYPSRDRLYALPEMDSLMIWYYSRDTVDWELIVNKDSLIQDTITIYASKIDEGGGLDLITSITPPSVPVKSNPYVPFEIAFNNPIDRIDVSRINVLRDSVPSTEIDQIKIDSADFRNLVFDFDWKKGSIYNIELLPAALVSLHQRPSDTIRYHLEVLTQEDLSNFDLKISGLDSTIQYLFSFRDKDKKEIGVEQLKGDSIINLQYPGLTPGEYSIEVIEDRNGNGKWDAGSFAKKTQPERVVIKSFGEFLANFDREEEWDIKFKD